MATMDAAVWTGPRQMVMRNVPVPEPGPGEVLVAVSAVGICGSELSGYLGQSSIRVPPLVMGHEAAGTLAESFNLTLGDGSPARAGTRVAFNPLVACGACDRCKAGRENLCRKRQIVGAHRPGAFAPLVAIPAALCWPLPDHVSDVDGSLAEPLACGVRAAVLAQAGKSASMLIIGAGPIGLCCLAGARANGVEHIIMSDVAPKRLEVARRWGAQVTINAREADVIAATNEFQAGGVDVVIDAVGSDATRAQALKAVVPGGRVVYIGLHEEASPLAANYLVRQEITIAGSFAYTAREFAQALDMLDRGLVRANSDWLEERPLAAAPVSFEELLEGRVAATKIVLRV